MAMNEHTIVLNNQVYKYVIITKPISRMYLRFRDGKIIATVPYLTLRSSVENFILKNEKWVERVATKAASQKQLEISDGSSLEILGLPYKIKLSDHYELKEGELILNQEEPYADLLTAGLELLRPYTYNKAKFYFEAMYPSGEYAFPTLRYKHLKSKYGHYNRVKHEIEFNISLAFYPEEIVDYIIVHELAHIQEFNHQAAFYELIASVLPNYKTLVKRLKKEGMII
ncbi:MAG: DUF45 domain-containing protein [Bacilli bacterium]|nr:DUF45 domain-containing protein [Bacilli bacterium]MDD3422713.1 DUF45 domain-containing protein [Bacilli bacterium]